MKVRTVTEAERAQLREKARKQFPDDEMMQELHYVRFLHSLQTEGFSPQEIIRFYGAAKRPARV